MKKPRIAYALYHLDRIGHLCGEILYLQNVYSRYEYDIEIIIKSLDHYPKMNREVFDMMMKGYQVSVVSPQLLEDLISLQSDPITEIDGTLYNIGVFDTFPAFVRLLGSTTSLPAPLRLTAEQEDKGQQLFKALGIEAGSRIVTVHVREPGYLTELAYHSYRDADIITYIPAIQYLLSEGYHVVRIGDSTMKKLPISSPRLIDAPFDARASALLDPYIISRSVFYLGMMSGPLALALGFEIPILAINGHLHNWSISPKGIFVPKKIYSQKLRRFLTYKEIASSAIMNFSMTDEYNASNLDIICVSPEEILASTKEMAARIEGTYNDPAIAKIKESARTINHYCLQARAQNPNLANQIFGMAETDTEFSTEFIKRNPYFLSM